MYKAFGYHCTNYIDDFGGVATPDNSDEAFDALGHLFSALALESSPDKDSPPSVSMVFLRILVNTTTMTISVTLERLRELLDRCKSMLLVHHVLRHELQSLLGVISFVTACVRPARIFISTPLHTLRSYRVSNSALCLHTTNRISDGGAYRCLPHYNGVSVIKTHPWINDPFHLSSDACKTGAGGYFNG